MFEPRGQAHHARREARAAATSALAARYLDTLFVTVLTQMVLGHPPEDVREVAKLAAVALQPR